MRLFQDLTLDLPPDTAEFYRHTLELLHEANVPHLVGGAYAVAQYTGIVRHTKDLDIFVRPAHRDLALSTLENSGYKSHVHFPYWLAKSFSGENMVDIIYRSPNGLAEVKDSWFQRGIKCELLGRPITIIAPEEILLNKLFILNRDRCDLADVMHILRATAENLDWDHLLNLVQSHWRVLLAHLVLFGFVYPGEEARIPRTVLQKLTDRLHTETTGGGRVCNGTLFSHDQYLPDLKNFGYGDGRLQPWSNMTRDQLVDATISLDDPQRNGS